MLRDDQSSISIYLTPLSSSSLFSFSCSSLAAPFAFALPIALALLAALAAALVAAFSLYCLSILKLTLYLKALAYRRLN